MIAKITMPDGSIRYVHPAPRSEAAQSTDSLLDLARAIWPAAASIDVADVSQTRTSTSYATQITRACAAIIDRAVDGKGGSMLRQALSLSRRDPTTLTDDERAQIAMFEGINDWESAMIDQREASIAANDAPNVVSWPPPPVGLHEFLAGF